jgi:glyoxylase-like metal-dependent hydrolase (beta-lactamase superfamily II)
MTPPGKDAMTEPAEIAPGCEQVTPGVWHWRVSNRAIGGSLSSSQLVAAGADVVLVDPVRLAPEAMAALPRPTATCLTAKCHQRSAWHYRDELDAPVWAPRGTAAMDAEADHRYAAGDVLPGGLRAVHTPGPEDVHFCFLLETDEGVLLCSDLLSRRDGGELEFVPLEYHDDPAATRCSVEGLLDLPFAVLCLDHGPPLTDDPKAAIRALLERTA